MRLEIKISYQDGQEETYTAAPPEWAKWENKTGFTIQQVSEKIGISDFLFLAYHAMKREAAGKPVKPFDIWCETVADVEAVPSNPKVTPSEV